MTTNTEPKKSPRDLLNINLDPAWTGILVATLRRLGGRVRLERLLTESGLDDEIPRAAILCGGLSKTAPLVSRALRDRADVERHVGRGGQYAWEWISDARRAKIAAEEEALREEERVLAGKVRDAVEVLRGGGFTIIGEPDSCQIHAERGGVRFQINVLGFTK